ncbi:MAG: PhoX family protein, partial [Actinobacteria bacterium]|nr:PhoX family protein [Actinomycetota bacterium]
CFTTAVGGWIYTSNSEVAGNAGGCGALRFSAAGEVEDAYPIVSGTSSNCAGGATPWGTWLSCEEHPSGLVWECDPLGRRQAIAHPRMGAFTHEAVAVDPIGRQLYMTEDVRDGRFYRYSPARYPDLSEGQLEVLVAGSDTGEVTWAEVPDPSGEAGATRHQVPESKRFNGGEGIWYDAGFVYFTTKGDDRVWIYDTTRAKLDILYDAAALDDPPLTGVDNIVVAPSGDVIVAEDGGDMDLVLITPDRVVARLVKVTGQDESELCGPAFDPSGKRLYFSSQRGPAPRGPGITYEVTGPFRNVRAAPSAGAPPSVAAPNGSAEDGGSNLTATALVTAAGLTGLGLIASALAVRKLRDAQSSTADEVDDG